MLGDWLHNTVQVVQQWLNHTRAAKSLVAAQPTRLSASRVYQVEHTKGLALPVFSLHWKAKEAGFWVSAKEHKSNSSNNNTVDEFASKSDSKQAKAKFLSSPFMWAATESTIHIEGGFSTSNNLSRKVLTGVPSSCWFQIQWSWQKRLNHHRQLHRNTLHSVVTTSSPLQDPESPNPLSLSKPHLLRGSPTKKRHQKAQFHILHNYCNFLPWCAQQPKSLPKHSAFDHAWAQIKLVANTSSPPHLQPT